jgi:radical SAM superfamily enzyme YgiQ (UPF0313 family)
MIHKKKVLLISATSPMVITQPTDGEINAYKRYLTLRFYNYSYGVDPKFLGLIGNRNNQNDGLLHLAKILKNHGHEVIYVAPIPEQGIAEMIDSIIENFYNVDFVGFYAHTCSVYFAELISKELKRRNKNIVTILGGPHAAGIDFIDEFSSIDIYVRGRAHRSLLWIIENPQKLRGFISEKDVPIGFLIKNESELFLDPEYSFLNVKTLPVARVYTSLGCGKIQPCLFCGSLVGHNNYIKGDLAKIFKNIDNLVQNYNTQSLYIGDEDFLKDPEHAERFIDALHFRYKGVLNFTIQSHVESICRNERLLQKIENSGMCLEIQIGAESANQKILDLSKKICRAKNIEKAAMLVKQHGIILFANWLSWLPGESIATHNYTTDFIAELMIKGLLDYSESYIVVPYPGTEMYVQREKLGIEVLDWDFSKWRPENKPIWRYVNGPSTEIMYQEHHKRIEVISNIYKNKITDLSLSKGILDFDPLETMLSGKVVKNQNTSSSL